MMSAPLSAARPAPAPSPRGGRPRAASRRSALAFAVLALLLILVCDGARAGSPLAEGSRAFVERQIVPGGEVEVTVGDPDPRLDLAPCRRFEPFLPPAARLWGRTSLGVRCVDGANWTVYLPVQVKVFAPVLVAARPLPRGHALTADDVRAERLDLASLGTGAYGAEEPVDGLVASRPVAAGEPLRKDFVRPPPVLAAGDPVRIVFEGRGFAVTTDGKALSAAGDGQSARVVTAAGRVLSGTARPGRIVEIR
jgi:flagellar basal body P-ring formation protein FlgA